MSLFAVTTFVVFHFALNQSSVDGDLAAGILWVTLLFAAMHLPAWIAEGGLQFSLIPSALMVFFLGLVLGFATRASGTIYLAIALHLANNLLAQWFSPD